MVVATARIGLVNYKRAAFWDTLPRSSSFTSSSRSREIERGRRGVGDQVGDGCFLIALGLWFHSLGLEILRICGKMAGDDKAISLDAIKNETVDLVSDRILYLQLARLSVGFLGIVLTCDRIVSKSEIQLGSPGSISLLF